MLHTRETVANTYTKSVKEKNWRMYLFHYRRVLFLHLLLLSFVSDAEQQKSFIVLLVVISGAVSTSLNNFFRKNSSVKLISSAESLTKLSAFNETELSIQPACQPASQPTSQSVYGNQSVVGTNFNFISQSI